MCNSRKKHAASTSSENIASHYELSMSKFSLSVVSFTPPTLPAQPTDEPPSSFRAGFNPIAAATSPLGFSISLPSCRETNPPYPATHLQLAYSFEGTGDIFTPSFITSKDLVKSSTEEEPNLYTVEISPDNIPRPKVVHEATRAADVNVYALAW